MSIAISLILVVFFLLMNAFFVVAEFSLVRIRKSQVDMLVANGAVGAKICPTGIQQCKCLSIRLPAGDHLGIFTLGWLGNLRFQT